MDEENSVSTEVTETDLAAFDEDWGGGEAEASETAQTAEDAAESAGTEAAQEPAAQTDTSENAEGGSAAEPGQTSGEAAENGSEAGDQRFELVYMQQPRTVGREEVIALAQKGLDYDRVTQQRDELRQAAEAVGGLENVREFAGLMSELAQSGGMTVEQVIDSTRAGIISRRDKVDMNVATERAKLQRLQNTVEARNRREAEEQTRATAEKDRQNAQFGAFMKAYPQVKPEEVPQEVWDAFRAGEDLVSAYSRYDAKRARAEAAQLREQIETLRKNSTNREKAAPSQQTAGVENGKTDPFDEGWDID